jgi:hypothetical protein
VIRRFESCLVHFTRFARSCGAARRCAPRLDRSTAARRGARRSQRRSSPARRSATIFTAHLRGGRVKGLAVCLAIGCLFAGCSDAAVPEPGPSCELACERTAPTPSLIELTSCVESRFPLELDRVVYELPAGYETAASATSPQRVYVALASCEGGTFDNVPLGAFSLGQIGVFVDAPQRGQGGNADIFTLEIVTDSMLLRDAFAFHDFPVTNGTSSMSDQTGLRNLSVTGDAEYEGQAVFPPIGDGPVLGSPPIPGSVAQHSIRSWYQDDRTCYQYFGTAEVTFTASQGILSQAMPALGPLRGMASMSFSCQSHIQFANTTLDPGNAFVVTG